MTAPVPRGIDASSATATTDAPDTPSALGAVAGDTLVVVQMGIAAGTATPVAPSLIGGSGTVTWTQEGLANAGANNGRSQGWRSSPLASGDLSATIRMDKTGYGTNTHRFAVFVLPGLFTLAQQVGSTANTGSTPQSLTDINRGAIVITALSCLATGVAATVTYDGATSGTKFQRSPYVNSSGSSTTTTGAHGSHYSSNSVSAQADYQEYDATDTISSVLWNNNVSNTTHAVIYLVYQQPAVLGVPTETDSGVALAPRKIYGVGKPTETDTALALNRRIGIGIAAETDQALPLAARKVNVLGTAVETDTARGLARPRTMGKPSETDLALALTAYKYNFVEVGIGNPPSGYSIVDAFATISKNYPTDSGEARVLLKQGSTVVAVSPWNTLTDTPTLYTVAVEPPATGTGFSVRVETRTTAALDPLVSGIGADAVAHLLHVATETDTARSLSARKTKALGVATTVELALPLAAIKRRVLGIATEVDRSVAIGHTGGFNPPPARADVTADPHLIATVTDDA